jgi:hypothetical protein
VLTCTEQETQRSGGSSRHREQRRSAEAAQRSGLGFFLALSSKVLSKAIATPQERVFFSTQLSKLSLVHLGEEFSHAFELDDRRGLLCRGCGIVRTDEAAEQGREHGCRLADV